MTKLDSDSLQNFIAGKSNESDAAAIERALTDSQIVVDTSVSAADDSLVAALRSANPVAMAPDSAAEALVEQISQLHPRRKVSVAELERLLEPAVQPGDLGTIGRYRVLELLASGGMGLVFRAVDAELERTVCIKLLDPTFRFNPQVVARFERESREVARLQHERIVTVLDMGQCRGLPWFAMPLLGGMSLRTRLRALGPLDEATALRYLRQIADGLGYAHQQGLLHRDIKPDNLWITATDEIKILDFGLARPSDESASISQPGTLIGTPSYMSPEQITGKPLDPRSDLFGVGAVLVEMLTGKSPFQRDNVISTLLSVANEPISFDVIDPEQRISLPVRRLIHDLVQIDPSRRIASAEDLSNRLTQLDGAGAAPRARRDGAGVGHWPGVLAGAFLGVALCLGGWALWSWQDKGTLVVEAHDPAVEVKVANERVTVVDPISGRQYQIRVGATPLPSGVYQLEMADPTGDLTFSSSTIAIRRGERTIVQVTLRPPVGGEAAAATNATEPGGTNPESPSKPAEDTSSADPSFDPAARERFGELLPKLPAISILPTTSAGTLPPLTESASVQRPVPLGECTSWTLETPMHGHHLATNCDGSLFAALEKDIVWIRDIHGGTRYALPLRGKTGFAESIRFDNRYPNLLSASSYIGGDGTETSNTNAYEISIWRLNADHAEMLFRFPASNFGYACWDQGYRLAHYREGRLSFFRLDTGVTTPIEGIPQANQPPLAFDRLKGNSISPDGRWLATQAKVGGGTQINIWNLELGHFKFSILENGAWQWNTDSSHLAVCPDRNNFSASPQFQIWDLSLQARSQEVVLDATAPRPNQDPSTLASALDPDFRRVAWLTRDGELCIRSLGNNRQASAQLDTTDPPKSVSLAWQPDGKLVVTSRNSRSEWRPIGSEVHGEITKTDGTFYLPDWIGDRRDPPFSIWSLQGVTDRSATIAWPTESPADYQSRDAEWRNVMGMTLDGTPTSMSKVFVVAAPHFNARSIPGPMFLSFSPDGRYGVLRTKGERGSQDTVSIVAFVGGVDANTEIEDLVLLEQPYRFGESGVAWSADGRLIGLAGHHGVTGRKLRLIVFDTSSNTPSEFDTSQFPEWRLGNFTSWGNGFLASFVPRDRSGPRWKSVFLDPSNLQVSEFKLLEDFQNVRVLWQRDDQVVFEADRFDDDTLARRGFQPPLHLVRATVSSDQLTNVQSIARSQYLHIEVSPDGQFALTTRSADNRDFVVSITTLPAVFDGTQTEPIFEQTATAIQNPLWHPSGRCAAWMSTTKGLSLYDVDARQLKTLGRNFASDQFRATSFGWYVAVGNELVALTHTGDYLGRAVLTKAPTAEAPTLNYWILSDGSLSQDGNLASAILVNVEGNRVYCRNAADYASDSSQPTFPRIDALPFLLDANADRKASENGQ